MSPRARRWIRVSFLLLLDFIASVVVMLITNYVVEANIHLVRTFFWPAAGLVLLQLVLMLLFSVYRIRLIDSSVELLIRGAAALGANGSLILLITSAFFKDISFALRLSITYSGAILLVLLGYRFLYRLVNSYHFRADNKYPKAIVYGAGDVGSQLARLHFKQRLNFAIVGFIDDESSMDRQIVQGIPVLGGLGKLEDALLQNNAQILVIAITNLSSERMREVLDVAVRNNVEVKIIPSLFERQEGRKNIADLRSINYDDLLGRSPVKIERGPIQAMVDGKRVLITGAGGSIGSEISRQILTYNPEQMLLFDIDETELHDLSLRLHSYQREFSSQIIPIVGDVTNAAKVKAVFETYRPQIVFHAAAYKHVPMMEYYPEEAVRTNVFGTQTLLSTAKAFQSEKCILISTDKAVNPTNVMGATKRVAELIARQLTSPETEIVSVRFGNVLGSRGSMLPLFLEQISAGLPVTVTDKRVVRYFMTIREAVSLVFLASAIGHGGEVMVLDMGELVNIYDFAKRLVKYFGDGSSDVVITKLRPGEKLYEEKLNSVDKAIPTNNPKVFKAIVTHELPKAEFDRHLADLYTAEREEIVTVLQRLVPEYTTSGLAQVKG